MTDDAPTVEAARAQLQAALTAMFYRWAANEAHEELTQEHRDSATECEQDYTDALNALIAAVRSDALRGSADPRRGVRELVERAFTAGLRTRYEWSLDGRQRIWFFDSEFWQPAVWEEAFAAYLDTEAAPPSTPRQET